MNKKKFVDFMTILALGFNQEVNLNQVEIYYHYLKDLDLKRFELTISNIINTKKRFPTIAEIKEEYYNLTNGNDTAENEWGCVLDAVKKYGYYKQDELLNSLKPLTRYVVERLGVERLCLMETSSVIMEHRMFVDMYNDLKDKNKYEEITNNFKSLGKTEDGKIMIGGKNEEN